MTNSHRNRNTSSDSTTSRRRTRTIALACILAASGQADAFGRTSTSVGIPASSSTKARRASLAPNHLVARGQYPNGNSASIASAALYYRDGDDEESSTRVRQHEEAAATLRKQREAQVVSSLAQQTNNKNSLWDSLIGRGRRKITARRGHTESEQFAVDEYLEYLDKRYKRMHGESAERPESKTHAAASSSQNASRNVDNGVNTAWNWLMQSNDDSDCDADCQRQKQEAALEVLGLAELASAELLRKHHLPVPEEDEDEEGGSNGSTSAVVIDVPAGRVASLSSSALVSGLAASVASLKKAQDRQVTLAALAARTAFYKSIKASITSMRIAIKNFVPTLINAAGGKKVLKITSAVAVAMFVMVVKPLGLVALQGAQSS